MIIGDGDGLLIALIVVIVVALVMGLVIILLVLLVLKMQRTIIKYDNYSIKW